MYIDYPSLQRTANLSIDLFIYLSNLGAPGVLGILGGGLFIFRKLGSTANYFRGAGEQAHIFGNLGSTAKRVKKNIRLPFYLIL